MWIINLPLKDVATGSHLNPGDNAMLIQITDPDKDPPRPVATFKEIHQFRFLDAEDYNAAKYGEENLISDEQAHELVRLLQHAIDNEMNVIVHCHAGRCRSGAVTEVGVVMGLEDTGRIRQPNMRVKRKMIRSLKWGYD
jgi:predicted protein tyrosine phosphatase